MNIIRGNLLDIPTGIICHQVNCLGAMNSGIAKQIRDKWPIVYTEYRKLTKLNGLDICFGTAQIVQVSEGLTTNRLYVCNIFGQYVYGGPGISTNYDAVRNAFVALRLQTDSIISGFSPLTRGQPIYIPHMMGCGLGGGDWPIYQSIVSSIIPNATIVQLP